MSLALKIILWTEIALGLLWTKIGATTMSSGGLQVVASFFYIYVLFAVFFLFAAWAHWKHPDTRRITRWIMGLPVAFWFLPMVMRGMAGGDLSTEQSAGVILLLAVVGFGFCWFLPRRVAPFVPNFLMRSRLLNWLIILALIAGWAFFVFAWVYLANSKSPSTSGTGEGMGMVFVLAAIYMCWLGVGSFLVSTWAWLSLRGGTELASRKLNYAQMVCAAPGVICGILIAIWIQGQSAL